MVKSIYIILLFFVLLGHTNCKSRHKNTIPISIIPQPTHIVERTAFFDLNDKTEIACTNELILKAEYLADVLTSATGHKLPITKTKNKKNTISLLIDESLNNLGKEGYELKISSKQVYITGASEAGIFYGIQSFRQLLPNEFGSDYSKQKTDSQKIPCVSITDIPRFKWRGLMLDCSRTFWSKTFIKRTIRLMSFYKMNVLHLHLTDDQGWRIEIDKYPELTQKGAQFPEKWNEPKEREGYYSKEEIREIVDYAKQHSVTIVPEIEMPGHSLAVLACYPELSCTGGPFEIHPFFKGPGIHKDIFCAGNEKTFEFLQNVLREVFEMFPSEYIHIGGDEAPKERWELCDKCQKRIFAEGLTDEHELQSWFIKRVEKYISENGKKLIGWDEILEGGLSSTASVMYWRGGKKDVPNEVVSMGNNIVMSPTTHCYFDYNYERISTMKAYEFNPVPKGITNDHAQKILGLQANFWSHIDRTEPGVDKQLFPRILSIAEIGWSPESERDSGYFKQRIKTHLKKLEKLGVYYYPDSSIISN